MSDIAPVSASASPPARSATPSQAPTPPPAPVQPKAPAGPVDRPSLSSEARAPEAKPSATPNFQRSFATQDTGRISQLRARINNPAATGQERQELQRELAAIRYGGEYRPQNTPPQALPTLPFNPLDRHLQAGAKAGRIISGQTNQEGLNRVERYRRVGQEAGELGAYGSSVVLGATVGAGTGAIVTAATANPVAGAVGGFVTAGAVGGGLQAATTPSFRHVGGEIGAATGHLVNGLERVYARPQAPLPPGSDQFYTGGLGWGS